MAREKKSKKKDQATRTGEGSTSKADDGASSSELLERFRSAAMKVRAHRIQPCRADLRLALANARLGVESVFGVPGDPERSANIKDVKAALPELSVKKVLELPELARALLVAAGKAAVPAAATEIEEKLAVIRELRAPLLATAEVLAGRGLFDKAVVAKIRSASGKYDLASDGIALVDLFQGSAETVKGTHPFTEQELEKLRAASEWLQARFKPDGAGAGKAEVEEAPKRSDAEDLRDRLWTLMLDRHSDLRAMGYYRFRDAFETQTPRLQSRIGTLARGSAPNGATGEAPEAANDVDVGGVPASVP